MNHQTRRDIDYKRQLQYWVEHLAIYERRDAAINAQYAHITEETVTPEIEAAYDAWTQTYGQILRQCARELGHDGQERARKDARTLASLQIA